MDETAAIARLEACGVIPVVVIEDASRAIDLAHALVAGGIDVFEVTLRRPAGLAAPRQTRSLQTKPPVWKFDHVCAQEPLLLCGSAAPVRSPVCRTAKRCCDFVALFNSDFGLRR